MANERAPSELSDATIDDAYRRTRGVAGAIAGSLLMYVVVVETLMRTTPAVSPPPYFQTLRIVFFVLAGAMIFMTTVVKGVLLRAAPADPAARLTRIRSASIAGLAMCEIPVVLGLVLVLIGHARQDFYMLLAISCYMMVRHFPRRGVWDEYLLRGRTTVIR